VGGVELVTAPAIDFVAPAFQWVPERIGSYGDEAIDLAALAGRDLDPEQRLAVDAMLSYGPGGKWVALEEAIVESRQNGKTTNIVLPVALFDLFMLPPDRVVWTAHVFKTARDAFDDFVVCIETAPELSRRVKNISYGNGEEAIELHSGATLEFLARHKGGGRGLGGKRVVMDEGLFLSPLTMSSLLPVLSARPNPQIMYASSAGVATSEYLRGIRDRGRKGRDPSLIYLEWCSPEGGCAAGDDCDHALERDGCALDNEDNWRMANHSLDRRITREYVRSERRALAKTPLEFARERCGWWDAPAAKAAIIIPLDVWQEQLLPVEPQGAPAGFAVDMTPDRQWTSIGVFSDDCAEIELEDGRPVAGVVDLVEHRHGNKWLLESCKALWQTHRKPFAIDPKGPAASEIATLREAGIEVVEPGPADLASASADLHDGFVDDRTLFHTGRPELDAAMEGAIKRNIGDGFAYDRKKGAVISPLYAVTLAKWAASQAGAVSIFGGADLDLCDACGINPHEDPDGEHSYLCEQCRPGGE
jgi:hypothetical protein